MKRNKRKQRGITLIALIISIIVMLILVGVTVTVSLNGGLFKKSKTAANDTQIEAEKEQLLSAVIGAIGEDADVNFTELDSNLPNGWTVTDGTYKSPNGNKFTVDKNGTITEESKNLGKYVKYKEITWIVLYDDKDKVELISADALGSVTLGDNTFEGGKTAYNNLIATLTQACKDETGIKEGIRNVGGPAEDPTDLDSVTLDDLKGKGFEPNTDNESKIKSLIEDIKQEDEDYLEDYNQMKKLGILKTDNSKEYWLGYRYESVSTDHVQFQVPWIHKIGQLFEVSLCYVYYNSANSGYTRVCAVRPVIRLDHGILDEKSGGDTRENPIILD